MNLRLADQLTMRGWVVDVAFLFDRHDFSMHANSYPRLKLIQMHADSRVRRLLLPLKLARLARDYHLVLAGLDLAATNYGYLAARLAGKTFVAWVHTAFNEHARLFSRLTKVISLFFYKRIRCIVFPSLGAMDSLSQALGGKPVFAHWHVIENFLDTRPKGEVGNAALPRHIFAKPVVLSIGRLSAVKAYDRLIRVHAVLRQRGVMHHMVIVGEGPEREQLEALAERLGVVDTCFFPGYTPNPQAWLEASSVFALSSRYEGLPLVLIEALQSGIPVASMDCPSGPREILDGGESGLLVPPGDENALAKAIARLLADPALRTKFSERGKRKAQIYDPSAIIPRWEKLLGNLIHPLPLI